MLSLILSAGLIGLIGSFHCIGMCGGLQHAFMQVVPANSPKNSFLRIFFTYHLGRLITYLLITSVFSALPFLLQFGVSKVNLANILRAFSAILIIMVGINQLLSVRIFSRVEAMTMHFWKKLQRRSAGLFPPQKSWQHLSIGMLWGALPCGHIYNVAALASSATLIHGNLSLIPPLIVMLVFFISTLPSFLLLAHLNLQLSKHQSLKKALALFLILLGLYILASIFL